MAIKSRKKEEQAELDMTPMLDIVFIMLIFFIVTTVFVKEAGIEILKPNAFNVQEKKNAYIFVGINESGDIYLDKKVVEPAALRTRIEAMLLENPEGGVVIQADRRSKVVPVLQVIDAAKAAGVKDVSVAASSE